MASINNNFINYKDFDIKKLELCEGKKNNGNYNHRTFEINYEYPDGKIRKLRLRSPALFSYGIKTYPNSSDYLITIKSFYDEEKKTEGEIGFKETLDSIMKFSREELGKMIPRLKRGDDLEKIEIVNERGFFFPKLFQDKTFDRAKFTGGDIATKLYAKSEHGNMEEVELSYLTHKNCFVVSVIEISDIFIRDSTLKLRHFLSDVIVIRTDVPSPHTYVKTMGLTLDSEDER